MPKIPLTTCAHRSTHSVSYDYEVFADGHVVITCPVDPAHTWSVPVRTEAEARHWVTVSESPTWPGNSGGEAPIAYKPHGE